VHDITERRIIDQVLESIASGATFAATKLHEQADGLELVRLNHCNDVFHDTRPYHLV
jgi:hypothetical protein